MFLYFADAQPQPESGPLDTPRRYNEHTLTMGLDVCAKALNRLFEACSRYSEAYQNILAPRLAEIAELAIELANLCDHPRLQAAPGLVNIKLDFGDVVKQASTPDQAPLQSVSSQAFPHHGTNNTSWPVMNKAMRVTNDFGVDGLLESYGMDIDLGWSHNPVI